MCWHYSLTCGLRNYMTKDLLQVSSSLKFSDYPLKMKSSKITFLNYYCDSVFYIFGIWQVMGSLFCNTQTEAVMGSNTDWICNYDDNIPFLLTLVHSPRKP